MSWYLLLILPALTWVFSNWCRLRRTLRRSILLFRILAILKWILLARIRNRNITSFTWRIIQLCSMMILVFISRRSQTGSNWLSWLAFLKLISYLNLTKFTLNYTLDLNPFAWNLESKARIFKTLFLLFFTSFWFPKAKLLPMIKSLRKDRLGLFNFSFSPIKWPLFRT